MHGMFLTSPYFNPTDNDLSNVDFDYKHNNLKPAFPKDLVYQPYQPLHNVHDRGEFADKSKKNLFSACKEVKDLTVHLGSELDLGGGQLKDLTNEQKDELSLLLAERGVVVVRKQQFTGEELRDWGKYFGPPEQPLHQHASSGVPKQRGLDELHVVWHDENMKPSSASYTQTDIWHSDVSFEHNPPGFTGLYNLRHPIHGGGDTLFSSNYGLYDALSPEMRRYLESLSAVHSGIEQAEGAASAGVHVRRPGTATTHPIVRTIGPTGWKAVYVNPAFTREIVGVSKHESSTILNMLYNMMTVNSDLTLRVQWEEGTIVLWNNAVVNHSATYNFWRPEPSCRRHAVRFAATGPIPSLHRPDGTEGVSRTEAIWEENGWDVDALRAREGCHAVGGFKD